MLGPFVLKHYIFIKIETNLAHTGLNSDHVKFQKSNRLNFPASAPEINFNPTSRSQTSLSIRTLKRNYAVIPKVIYIKFRKTRL